MRYLIAIAVGLAVTAAAVLLGPARITPSTQHTGDPTLAATLAEHATTGHHRLAAFTIDGGETTFAGVGADDHDEFEIGSVTKTFTAGILADRGLEETTVGEIIDASGSDIADITLRELADHTSGLPRLAGLPWWTMFTTAVTGGNPYAGITRENVIDAALGTPLSDRGEYSYSNLGSALLGQLLAIEADTTYEQLLAEGVPDLAWSVDDDGTRSHNGGTYGFSTTLLVHPDAGRAVFVVGDTEREVATIAAALHEELS